MTDVDSRKQRIEKKIEEMRKERRTNRALVERVSEKVITELYDTILEKEEQLDKVMRRAEWTIGKVDRRVNQREERFKASLSEKIVEVDENLEAGLDSIRVASRMAFEFLKTNLAEFVRLQMKAEQTEQEAEATEVLEIPRTVSLEDERVEEEQSAETDTLSTTIVAPMEEDEEYRSILSAVREFDSDSEDSLPEDPLAQPKSPILELQNVFLEDSDEERSVKELITEIQDEEILLDKYDCEHAISTFFSTPKGQALIKVALKLPDVTVSTRNALNGRSLKELFFDCQCKNKLRSFLEMFFENFSKDYRQPDFYMRFFQAIYLSDFYQFVRQYSNSQIYNWHTTLDVSFPFLDFFPQIFEKTRMSHLFNYQNVCKMIDELKSDILSGKAFFCFIQRTPDECIDYIRALKNENIHSEDVSHDSSYVKITSDE